jgi:hypothetical protein
MARRYLSLQHVVVQPGMYEIVGAVLIVVAVGIYVVYGVGAGSTFLYALLPRLVHIAFLNMKYLQSVDVIASHPPPSPPPSPPPFVSSSLAPLGDIHRSSKVIFSRLNHRKFVTHSPALTALTQ